MRRSVMDTRCGTPLFPRNSKRSFDPDTAGAGSIYYFYKFVTFVEAEGGHAYLWKALGLAVIAFVCGLVYFLGHVNKEEEIHITQ